MSRVPGVLALKTSKFYEQYQGIFIRALPIEKKKTNSIG
jgi:hypothetical protein